MIAPESDEVIDVAGLWQSYSGWVLYAVFFAVFVWLHLRMHAAGGHGGGHGCGHAGSGRHGEHTEVDDERNVPGVRKAD